MQNSQNSAEHTKGCAYRRWQSVSQLAHGLKEPFLLVIMIKQEQFLCTTKNGVVRGKSWTRQTLSDAWESTNWDGLCGTPWQMVAPELKWTKEGHSWQRRSGTPIAKDCGWENAGGWAEKFLRFVCWHWGSRTHWRLSGLCCACIAWKSDKTTKWRTPRTNHNYHWENLDGKSKDECRPRQSLRQSEWKRGKELELSEV